ncbi:hypothetical protein C8R45DRAFT_1175818 [Mycena sanguinolenta]|nr:hypothetical protein C8R45DRAFT_1175818 [Mycena sanguinolenta]
MPPPQILEPGWVEEYNSNIKYSGSWSREYGIIYHDSGIMRTTKLGDTMSLEFRGSGIKFLGTQGWNHSIFTVTLDGQRTIVNGSCCISTSDTQAETVPQFVQFEATNLPYGKHALTIKNDVAGPLGTVLEVDSFLIKPTIVNITVSPPGQSVQHTSPSANRSGPSPQSMTAPSHVHPATPSTNTLAASPSGAYPSPQPTRPPANGCEASSGIGMLAAATNDRSPSTSNDERASLLN